MVLVCDDYVSNVCALYCYRVRYCVNSVALLRQLYVIIVVSLRDLLLLCYYYAINMCLV